MMTKTNKSIIIIVIALVLIASGHYYWKKQKIQLTSLDKTASWKTYINEDYGFEFKYPENLEVNIQFDQKNVNLKPENPNNETFNWFQMSLSNKENIELFDFSLSINHPGVGFEGMEEVSEATINIDGVQFRKDVLLYTDDDYKVNNSGKGLILYGFHSGDNGYMVVADKSFEKLLDQIISTFKFTKPSIFSSKGTLTGHVDIGPFCPVEQEGKPCPVPPEAYSSVKIKIYLNYPSPNTLISTANVDSNGNYSLELNPGEYVVAVESPYGLGETEYNDAPEEIRAGKINVLNFTIDTGIR